MSRKLFQEFAFLERAYQEGANIDTVELENTVSKARLSLWKSWRGLDTQSAVSPASLNDGVEKQISQCSKFRQDLHLSPVFSTLSKSVNASWEYLTSNLLYVFYLLLVFAIVSGIYFLKVYPEISNLMAELGQTNNQLSFLKYSGLGFVGFSIFIGVALVSGLFVLQARINRLELIPSIFEKLPFLASFSKRYNDYVLHVYSLVSIETSYVDSFERVTKQYSLTSKALELKKDALYYKLVYADKHNFLETEIESFFIEATEILNVRLLKMRSRIILLFQLTIFISLGCLIAGFYLPIFSIGTAI